MDAVMLLLLKNVFFYTYRVGKISITVFIYSDKKVIKQTRNPRKAEGNEAWKKKI